MSRSKDCEVVSSTFFHCDVFYKVKYATRVFGTIQSYLLHNVGDSYHLASHSFRQLLGKWFCDQDRHGRRRRRRQRRFAREGSSLRTPWSTPRRLLNSH